jgi:hypothetical protein
MGVINAGLVFCVSAQTREQPRGNGRRKVVPDVYPTDS